VHSIAIAVVDVGKVANTGWWHISISDGQCGGRDLNELATKLAKDLSDGVKVALGFEAPMFIPRASATAGLGRQRVGEAGRPWCAGAGATALAFGLQEAAFVLTDLALQIRRPIRAGLDLARLASNELAEPHIADARAAAVEFQRRYRSGAIVSDISESEVISLGGTALLVAGLTRDTTLVTVPCTVVKAPPL